MHSAKSYVEQLWISHLHMAYTLPFLDRTKEARAHVATLLKMRPGFYDPRGGRLLQNVVLRAVLSRKDVRCVADRRTSRRSGHARALTLGHCLYYIFRQRFPEWEERYVGAR